MRPDAQQDDCGVREVQGTALGVATQPTPTTRRSFVFAHCVLLSPLPFPRNVCAQCADDVITIVAMLDAGNAIFYRPKDRAVHADNARANFVRGKPGDHLALMDVYNQWVSTGYSTQWCYENYVQVRSMKKARDVREQLEGLCERVEIELESAPSDMMAISKAITSGFFFNCAKLQKNGSYRTLRAPFTTMNIHPSSGLAKLEVPPRHILFHALVTTTKEYARNVLAIEPQWLLEIAPHVYKQKDVDDLKKKMPKGRGKAA